jgi:hypothetical protein
MKVQLAPLPVLLLALASGGCGKSSSSNDKGQPVPVTPAVEPGPTAPAATGTETSVAADTETDDEPDVTAGTLALTFSAISAPAPSALHLLEAGNGFKSTSITSGAPDAMRLRIAKIELLPAEGGEGDGGDGEGGDGEGGEGEGEGTDGSLTVDEDMYDVLAGIVTDSAVLADLQALVGNSFESGDALMAALAEAGMTEAELTEARDQLGGGEDGDSEAEGTSGSTVIFESDEGALIEITGSTVDLGGILAAAGLEASESGALELSVPTGNYRGVRVTYMRGAEIKGCVTGEFGTPGSTITGLHTYCTRDGKSTFEGSAWTNADFENQEAEFMLFDIGAYSLSDYAGQNPEQTFEREYILPGGVEVLEGEPLAMTMAIDLNRMLRFYNQGVKQGYVPDAPDDFSYFFDFTFHSATFVFAGSPGSILGYELLANVCSDAAFDATTEACPSGNSSPVEVWMTVIAAQDGVPFIVNFLPTDDNTFTVLKGGTFGVQDFLTSNGDGTNDLAFALGAEAEGILHDFPADLSATAVGGTIPGVWLDGFQEQMGAVTVLRKL